MFDLVLSCLRPAIDSGRSAVMIKYFVFVFFKVYQSFKSGAAWDFWSNFRSCSHSLSLSLSLTHTHTHTLCCHCLVRKCQSEGLDDLNQFFPQPMFTFCLPKMTNIVLSFFYRLFLFLI